MEKNIKQQAETIHVLVASDNNYLVGLYTTLTSIIVANQLQDSFVFHIIDMGIKDNAMVRKFFEKFKNVKCEFHTIDPSVFQGANIGHGGLAAYARLYMGNLIATPKCIYVDLDILIGRNVRELWDMEMNCNVFYAVEDSYLFGGTYNTLANDCPFEPREHVEHYKYFNTGVLLIDLDAYRHCQVFEEALRLISTHGKQCKCWDQTLLNYICRGKIGSLASEWNIHAGLTPLEENTNYHYIAKKKPWNYERVAPSAKLWKLFYKIFISDWFHYVPSRKARKHNMLFRLRNIFVAAAPNTLSWLSQKICPQDCTGCMARRNSYRYCRETFFTKGLDPVSRDVYACMKRRWLDFKSQL